MPAPAHRPGARAGGIAAGKNTVVACAGSWSTPVLVAKMFVEKGHNTPGHFRSANVEASAFDFHKRHVDAINATTESATSR
jgi:hypothetical protein